MSGSPSLAHIIHKTASDVPHPNDSKKTLWDATKDVGPYTGPADAEFMVLHEVDVKQRASFTGIPPLGSGSDYTVFLQRLGVSFGCFVAVIVVLIISSSRWPVWINRSLRDLQMQYGTITASTTASTGKNCMRTLRLKDM